MLRRLLPLLLLCLPLQGAMCYSTQGYTAYQRGCGERWWPAHVDVDGLFYSDWREQGTATLFLPFFQPGENIFFLQGTAGRFKHMWVGNAGGGFRAQLDRCFGWGLNAFADYGRSNGDLNWWQFGFGAEMFGGNWEARINGYVPGWFNDRIATDVFSFTTVINGNQVEIIENRFLRTEKSRWGFDSEAGVGVCMGPGALWGLLGFYRFQGQGLPILQGPRARLEWRMDFPLEWGNAEAFAGAEWEYDKVFGHRTSLRLHLSVPLGFFGCSRRCCLTTVCRQMGRSVRRQPGQVLRILARNIITERDVGLWFFTENGMGVGSQVDPTNINDCSTNSIAGDVLFALNNDGVINTANAQGGSLTLKNNQQLYAFPTGTNMVTIDLGNGVSIPVTALPGNIGGTLNQPNAVPNVIAATNNRIFGITLTGGTIGVEATTVNDLIIDQATISGTSSRGASLNNVGGTVTVGQSTFTSNGGVGLFLENDDVNVAMTVNDNTFSMTPTGIMATAVNRTQLTLDIDGNTLSTLTMFGIDVEKSGSGGEISAVIAENTITGVTGTDPAIRLLTDGGANGGTLDYAVSNNTITGVAAGSGITFGFGPSGADPTLINGLVNNNTISTVGVALGLGNTMTNAQDNAIIEFSNNIIAAAASQAVIVIHDGVATTNVTITNNTDTATTGATAAYDLALSNGGTLCSTLTQNSTTRGANLGIVLVNNASTFETTDRDKLSANNNNISVAPFVGTITNRTTPCPPPVIPTG